MNDNFFSRWSRRKQDVTAGRTVDESALPEAEPVSELVPQASLPPAPVKEPSTEPLPSMDDVQALSPASDFQPFMRRGVTPDVRNAAMKKLFTDPHFNVMDGLDIYIGDYTQPDPLPAGMLEQMVGAQFLSLVQPPASAVVEASARDGAEENPDQKPAAQQGAAVVAQSPDSAAPMATTKTDHDHTDLQLQPDSAAADPQAGSGPR